MKNFINSLFSGPGGDISSKRFFALGCFVVAIVSQFTGQGFESVALWLGLAGGLLGVSAFTGK